MTAASPETTESPAKNAKTDPNRKFGHDILQRLSNNFIFA
jgi:hypothetical protein